MLTRFVPSTKEPLPIIGPGRFRTFDTRIGGANRDALTVVQRLLFEASGTLIDKSPKYGCSEAVIDEQLAGAPFQSQEFLATKFWTYGRRRGIWQIQGSLAKLQSPSIRLMQVPNLVGCEPALKILRGWQKDGRIDYLGTTHYTPSGFFELSALQKIPPHIEFSQFRYSIAERRAEAGFLDLCADIGTATLINRPFEQDGLFGCIRQASLLPWAGQFGINEWVPFFLKNLLSSESVTCLIPANRNPAQMRANLTSGVGELPDAAMRRSLVQLF